MDTELLDYFKGDELAANVWKSKYGLEGEKTPDQMHRRMAKEFFRIEEDYIRKEDSKKKRILSDYGRERKDLTEESIYQLFKDFKYIVPQGSVMRNLRSGDITSLSNCFVIGQPDDSYGGIFKRDQELVQLMKRRGGVGIDISTLRPKGVRTTNSAKTSSGAVTFMERFSNSTREVAQNGRRGALMISIDVNHPDVMDFIKIKRDLSKVTGANISVRVNNNFMKAVENDEDYILRFPCDANIEDLKYPDETINYGELYRCSSIKKRDIVYTKKIRAKEYWEEIIKSAHGYAEPGIIFVDNHYNYSPDGVYEQYKGITTNPCGEIFMQEYDACRLIALNLFGFVENPFTDKAEFNFDKFYEAVYEGMRLSDDLIDLELQYIDRIIEKIKSDPESDEVKSVELNLWENIKETGQSSRRTGLGFTGLGDTLAALGIKYDSDESLDIIRKIQKTQYQSSLNCTIDLSIQRGSFKGWSKGKEFYFDEDGEIDLGKNQFYNRMCCEFSEEAYRMVKYGRRNVSWSTVAPTGSVSILTQTTSGIEPLFQPFYTRRKKVNPNDENVRVDFIDNLGDSWQEFSVLHPKFKDWIYVTSERSFLRNYYGTENVDEFKKEDLQELFEKSPWYKSTANDIDWRRRVEIQSVIQKYITHSISSTINLPETITQEEVSEIYMEAWRMKLKGITIYRDGSRSGVLVNEPSKELVTFHDNNSPKRPKSLNCKVVRFNNNYEKWVAFVGLMDNKPYEIFTGKLGNIQLPGGVEVGEIRKVRLGTEKRYDFVYDGGVVEGISIISDKAYWNYGKLISGILRHGMPLHSVIETINGLNLDEENINTWKAGVMRALKKFMKDGKVIGITCTNCGGENIVFEEGCSKCLDCGSSKCG